MDRFQEGVDLLNSVLKTGDDDPEALSAGGLAYVRQGAFADAVSLLDQARGRHPDHLAIGRTHAAALWAEEQSDDLPPDMLLTNEMIVLAAGLCVKDQLDRAMHVLQCAAGKDPFREDILL